MVRDHRFDPVFKLGGDKKPDKEQERRELEEKKENKRNWDWNEKMLEKHDELSERIAERIYAYAYKEAAKCCRTPDGEIDRHWLVAVTRNAFVDVMSRIRGDNVALFRSDLDYLKLTLVELPTLPLTEWKDDVPTWR